MKQSAVRCLDRTLLGIVSERKLAGMRFVRVTMPQGQTIDVNPAEVRSITSLTENDAQAMADCMKERVPMPTIISAVARFFNLTPEVVLHGGRPATIIRARHVAMRLAIMAGHSSTNGAAAFGKRCHGTLLHASKDVLFRIANGDAKLAGEVEALSKLLGIPLAKGD